MRKLLLLLGLVAFLPKQQFAQNQDPVLWTCTYKAISETEGEVLISGIIQQGWHTYSQKPTDAGPISTTIIFAPSAEFELIGKTEESGAKEEFDKAFEAKLFVFEGKAEFKQKIKLKKKSNTSITLKLEYVCCNSSMCLPPKTVDLKVLAR